MARKTLAVLLYEWLAIKARSCENVMTFHCDGDKHIFFSLAQQKNQINVERFYILNSLQKKIFIINGHWNGTNKKQNK